ncbi:MAG: stage 0 sporulation family protein, partial [Clostridia bacterium]|nr:stage 0 sporulation family protein [Clostridia bacterium]
LEYGTVAMTEREVGEEEIVAPLKEIVRIATEQDKAQVEKNKKKEQEAFAICEEKILKHKLDMKLVDVEYTFDANKILFYFTAEGRVDFRELVKDLAGVFRTRIELRQIGIRDEAKMLGGIGICGRKLCCSSFLDGFHPVSIKMAKEQGLSLNPTKISGNCGRLMCCLKYEQNCYDEFLKLAPAVGAIVQTPNGKGTVQSVTILKGIAKVMLEGEGENQLMEVNFSDLKILKNNHKNHDNQDADMKELKKLEEN